MPTCDRRRPAAASSILLVSLAWSAASACAAGPVTDSPPPLSVLHFPADRDRISLTLALGSGVPVTDEFRINGKDVGLFLIDTGASHTVVDRSVAIRLNLPPDPTRPRGARAARRWQFVATRSLSLGGMEVANHPVVSADLSGLKRQ